MTRTHTFKNLNLRRKAYHNLTPNLQENHFRYLKFYSNPPSLLARSHCHVIRTPFETQKVEVHIFDRAKLCCRFCFAVTKEDLHPRKLVFLLNLRLRPTQKPKIWSVFYGKMFYIRKICSVNAK